MYSEHTQKDIDKVTLSDNSWEVITFDKAFA